MTLALMMATYEAWLFVHRRGKREHLWVAIASLAAAAYAGLMLVHYNVGPEWAIRITQLEMVPLIVVSHVAPLAAMDLAERPMRVPRYAFLISALVWLVLTPTVVGDEVVMWHFVLLDHPFPRRAETPLGTVAEIYALVLVAYSVVFLWRHRKGRERDFKYFVTAIGLWAFAAAIDAGLGLVGAPIPMSLVEYGFGAFALVLATGDVRRYMEMLGASQRDFRSLIERSPDAVAVLSGQQFVYGNAALLRTLGLEQMDQIVGRSLDDFVHAEDREAVQAMLASPEEDREVVTARFHGSAAEPVQFELATLPTEFDDQPAIVVMARDVTARKQLTARMMEMDRMITMGTVAAGVGHEINNPLSYVTLNLAEARRLIDCGSDQAQLVECLDNAIHGSKRITETVRSLALFSHHGASQKDLSLEKVIESAAAMSANEVAHRAKLVLELQPGLAVHGNETRLGQVLVNLLINAAQAIESGSADDNEVRVRSFAEGDLAVCEVSDTGDGIAEENLAQVFDPFFTTKPAGQGTGLGLGICKATIEEAGGRLVASSVVGEGSTFRVELPLVTRQLPSEPPAHSTIPPPRRGRLLFVDDERQVLRALSRALRNDADVVTASSVAEALEHLDGAEAFDLVVSDLMMPNVSGMDLHKALLKSHPTLARTMVFITGGAFTPEARAFQQNVDNVVLQKPIDLDRLRSYLRQAVEGEAR